MKNIYRKLGGILLLLFNAFVSFSQTLSYTANNKVAPYTKPFIYGITPGFYGGFNNGDPSNKPQAYLAVNAGFYSFFPQLYESPLQNYATGNRANEFMYYGDTLGMSELTMALAMPSVAHTSTDSINCLDSLSNPVKYQSEVFENLYLPIWDDSSNATTPVNDQNYYALYVYNVVKTYGQITRFYQVWSTADATKSSKPGLAPGQLGNWWENSPDPCDLSSLHAPVTSYIRMLRIAYEVVKSLDSTAYVTTGGIQYGSFLDALLRYTDNPNSGAVTTNYPLTGGAYFDVLSFDAYPQYELQQYNTASNTFTYFRHSDAAIQAVLEQKKQLDSVLTIHGYDGNTFPTKYSILSRANIPRKFYPQNQQIGSTDAQRNFMVKMLVTAQKNNIKQIYVNQVGDFGDSATSPASLQGEDLMGMYYNLNSATTATASLTETGVAVKTLTSLTKGYVYDSVKTNQLLLPSNIGGGAFKNGSSYIYVLWAKTSIDLSETAFASYTFASYGFDVYNWDYSSTNSVQQVASNTVALTGSPVVIMTANIVTGLANATTALASPYTIYPNPAKGNITIRTSNQSTSNSSIQIFDVTGRECLQMPLTFDGGSYDINLGGFNSGVYQVVISNANGNWSQKLVVQ